MSERGAVPTVAPLRRRALRLIGSFTSPLSPDHYLEMLNPLWSTLELRGRVEGVHREGATAVTVTIRPGRGWEGHLPGQYVRLGVEVDGVHHWRAYSLTSDPRRADGRIAITPKLVPDGKVSPYLFRRLRPGTIVRLGGVEGTFVLPTPRPARLLLVSAGSGITPIASMLRGLARTRELDDIVHLHCARTSEEAIFRDELHELHNRRAGYRLHERLTAAHGRLTPAQLDDLCSDWRERDAYVCGPSGLLHMLGEHWRAEGDPARMHVERFQPLDWLGDGAGSAGADGGMAGDGGGCGSGGSIDLCASNIRAHSDGRQPILVAGEQAGAKLPHGCRMGICHSCVGRLRSGRVRDLRTGRVHGTPGELLRTCVNAPEGPVEIEL
jgi:stearoyl-CoA 9-desaturase NADPH oxidoreductase